MDMVMVILLFTFALLAMEQRQNEDQRTLGELFFFLVDEMADITFSRSLCILMDALMANLQEILKLSEEQLAAFSTDFEARLPEYLQNALLVTNTHIFALSHNAYQVLPVQTHEFPSVPHTGPYKTVHSRSSARCPFPGHPWLLQARFSLPLKTAFR